MAFQTPSTLGVVHSPIEYSESIRPAGKYRAAPWLPLKEFDNRANEYLVMYSGIPVSGAVPVDSAGRNAGFTDLFPSSLLAQMTGGTTVITYDQTDADNGVINVTTGVTAVAGATVTATQLRTALKISAVGATVIQEYPLGVLSFNAYRFPGGDGSNPNGFQYTNFAFQNQVAITCDYVLEVPVQAGVLTEVSLTAGAPVLATNPVAIVLTGIDTTADSYTVTVNGTDQTADVTAITAADVTFGTVNIAANDVIVVNYVTSALSSPLIAGTPMLILASGGIKLDVGTYVKAGTTEGSFVPWVNNTDHAALILGQVISVDRTLNRGALDKVRTQYSSTALNTSRLGLNAALYSQPGSATSGKPGNLYRALGTDFNGVARINLLK